MKFESDHGIAFYIGPLKSCYDGVPKHIEDAVFAVLDDHLRSVTVAFMQRYCNKVNCFQGIKKYQ